jgi:hypothetical protein
VRASDQNLEMLENNDRFMNVSLAGGENRGGSAKCERTDAREICLDLENKNQI